MNRLFGAQKKEEEPKKEAPKEEPKSVIKEEPEKPKVSLNEQQARVLLN